MIWLAYKCAEIVRERGSDDLSPSVDFPYNREDKVHRCLIYMDTALFNQQLSKYGLHLENIVVVHEEDSYHSYRQLIFSRI